MNISSSQFPLFLLAVSTLVLRAAPAAETVRLTELDLTHLHYAGWIKPQLNQMQVGKPLAIAGQKFEHGVATYATSSLWLELDGRTERFNASVGVDDSANDANAAVVFTIFGDDRKLWESRVLKWGEPAQTVDLDLKDVRSLLLKIDHAGENKSSNLGDWVDARFSFAGACPRTVPVPQETAVVLTPKPPTAPRINGPRVYGCRPGHPFLFRIPTTGERPMKFAAETLPDSLRLDADNGIIIGIAPARGTYAVTLQAENRHGAATRPFKIVSGDTLALTPPMGWNHWYAHYNRVTDTMMREAADVIVRTGMADVGYAYVNIDDCWMNAASDATRQPDPLRIGPFRDAQGNIVPNKHFPDMPALTAYIHEKGLKAGIYTSPGPLTCGGYCGAYQHDVGREGVACEGAQEARHQGLGRRSAQHVVLEHYGQGRARGGRALGDLPMAQEVGQLGQAQAGELGLEGGVSGVGGGIQNFAVIFHPDRVPVQFGHHHNRALPPRLAGRVPHRAHHVRARGLPRDQARAAKQVHVQPRGVRGGGRGRGGHE